MQYHELKLEKRKSAKRAGRGISAGRGKTAGRGTKGQSARAGGKRRPGFEGGQTPLMKRLPKSRGFTSKRAVTENVYTGQLQSLKGKVDNFSLAKEGLTSSPFVKVKLISKGELTVKLEVSLQAASESATAAVQKAGGTFNKVDRPARQAKEKAPKK